MCGEDGLYDALLHLAGEVSDVPESVRIRTRFRFSSVWRDAVLVLAVSGGFRDCSGCGEIPMRFMLALFSAFVCRLWRLGVCALSFFSQVFEIRDWNQSCRNCGHVPAAKSYSNMVTLHAQRKRKNECKKLNDQRPNQVGMPAFHTLNSIPARSNCQHPSVLDMPCFHAEILSCA